MLRLIVGTYGAYFKALDTRVYFFAVLLVARFTTGFVGTGGVLVLVDRFPGITSQVSATMMLFSKQWMLILYSESCF